MKKRDPRINTVNTSLREYFIMFFILSAFNGFHMWLYQGFYTRGFFETNPQFAINILIIYVAAGAALFTGFTAFIRRISWDLPTRRLSEAASKIAKGDFSVRIASIRRDGKKDNVEVMFDDFNTMVQELSGIEAMKSDFIANVSHELKSPLAVIQSYAAALQDETLDQEKRREYIATIIEASQKLTMLVSNILKLNKLENQEILPEARPLDLGEQLRRCAVAFEESWESKNIHFEAELDDVSVCYDETLLELIWNNLLSNAVKFTDPYGSIHLKLKVQDGYARVSISNTGIGMDEETQKHIFDKFYQGDASHAQEGNGLGLPMVKRAVRLLGGTIKVESQPGQGAVFTVFLEI